MKKQRSYDKKVKHTRILLSDYLLLKGYAQQAGISMSQALHKLIAGLKPEPEPKPKPVQIPMPAFDVTSVPAIGVTSVPAIEVAGVPAIEVAGVPAIPVVPVTTNVQLRATVAKGGSSNGAKQV